MRVESRKKMPQLISLGGKIVYIVLVWSNFDGHSLKDLDSVRLQSDDFFGIVGKKAHLLDAQISQNLGSDSIIPKVRGESQLFVGLNRITSVLLKRVRLDLVLEPDPSALLSHVQQHAAIRVLDLRKRSVQLRPAIATHRTKHVAGETFRVHPHQSWIIASDVSLDQCDVLGTIESVKAVSEIYAPVSGTVESINESLDDAPESVNNDPHGDGWYCTIKLADTGELEKLMDATGYETLIAN